MFEIQFDRPLESPTSGLNPNRFAIFSEPIPMLAPGRKINLIFGKGPDFFPKEGEAVPLRYVVSVEYRPLQHRRRFLRKQKRYVDPPLVLDLQPFKHTAADRDDIHQIYQNLKDIKQVMKSWTNGHRLQINTITQAEIDERDRTWFEERELGRPTATGNPEPLPADES